MSAPVIDLRGGEVRHDEAAHQRRTLTNTRDRVVEVLSELEVVDVLVGVQHSLTREPKEVQP